MIDFVFTSVNGNLKLPVKEKVRNIMVFNFNINTEFAENLGIIKHFKYSKLSQFIYQQKQNSDRSNRDEFWFFFLFRLYTN